MLLPSILLLASLATLASAATKRQCTCAELDSCSPPDERQQPHERPRCFQQCAHFLADNGIDVQAFEHCFDGMHGRGNGGHDKWQCFKQKMNPLMCTNRAGVMLTDDQQFGATWRRGGFGGGRGFGRGFGFRRFFGRLGGGQGGQGPEGEGDDENGPNSVAGENPEFHQCMRTCHQNAHGGFGERFRKKAECIRNLGCALRRVEPQQFMAVRQECGAGDPQAMINRMRTTCQCLVSAGMYQLSDQCDQIGQGGMMGGIGGQRFGRGFGFWG